MKLATVIVTYNGMRWIDGCLRSLIESDFQAVNSVYVIDNGSTDGTCHYIHDNYPDVTILENGKNLGFGRACNIGIKLSLIHQADYVLLLNQDAWIEPTTLSCLIQTLRDHPQYGIMSPVHYDGTGDEIDRNFLANILGGSHRHALMADLMRREFADHYPCDFVNAAIWLISSECINKVGMFSKAFFHYGEDNNLVQRAQYHGFRIGFTPKAVAFHDRKDRLVQPPPTMRYLLDFSHYMIQACNITDQRSLFRILLSLTKICLHKTCWHILSFDLCNAAREIRIILSLWLRYGLILQERKRHKVPLS